MLSCITITRYIYTKYKIQYYLQQYLQNEACIYVQKRWILGQKDLGGNKIFPLYRNLKSDTNAVTKWVRQNKYDSQNENARTCGRFKQKKQNLNKTKMKLKWKLNNELKSNHMNLIRMNTKQLN